MIEQPSIPIRTTCRACGSPDLTELFSLGDQFVSDFVAPEKVKDGVKCPITLQLCNACTLVQLKHTAPQELLYTRHYWYRSGMNQSMKDALRDVTRAAERVVDLKPGDVVLDIGSNDGTLLRSYSVEGLIRIGCEPADNLATAENYDGLYLIHDFWSAKVYETQGIQTYGRNEAKDEADAIRQKAIGGAQEETERSRQVANG